MTNGILGGYPPGILGNVSPGAGLRALMPPETMQPTGQPERSVPGGLFWQQLAQAGVYNAMDPTKAGDVFSPDVLALLAPRFQEGAKKTGKGK